MKTKIFAGWILLCLAAVTYADTPNPLQLPDFYYYFTVQKLNKHPDYVFIAYPFQEIGGKGYKILEPANRLRVKEVLPSFYAISATYFNKAAADANPAGYFASEPRLIRSSFRLSPEAAYAEISQKKADSVTEIVEIVSASDKKLELKLKDRIYATNSAYTPFIVLGLIAGGAVWMIIAYGKSRKKSKR
jgi:hypothetical protein